MANLWTVVCRHADEDPARLAVGGLHELSYGELVSSAEELSSEISRYAQPGEVVALDATPHTALVAILAAQHLGVAFLPLDSSMPESRRQHVLLTARAKVLLTESGPFRFSLSATGDTSQPWPLSDPAYVIFTSGSTGLPKGVHVPTAALLERLTGLAQVPGFQPGEGFLALTPISFDIAMAELLLPMVAGGHVVAVAREARTDAAELQHALETYRPAVAQGTPSFWRLMLAGQWPGLAKVTLWCGGEAMTANLASSLLPRGKEVWNLYGPTEAAIWATAWRVEPAAAISLGDALPGTRIGLFEGGREVSGPGAEGEIVIFGAGIAEGYLGASPELASRFAPHGDSGEPAYATGDRARYRDDRSLEFLGRSDTQIKLRGHRIELGEIESVLEQHPSVVDAVVVLAGTDDADGGHLAAAVTASTEISARALRQWLLERLPVTMLPRKFEIVGSLPRTTAGKLDRVAIAGSLKRKAAV